MEYLLVVSGVGLVIGIALLRWIKKRRDERKRWDSDPILLEGWKPPPE